MDDPQSLLRHSPTHILVNPTAGGSRGGRSLRDLQDLLKAARVPAEFHTLGSLSQMETTAASLIRGGAKSVLVAGGDGTLQALVNVPGASDITIGILPCGSGNDFAAALGLPQDPVEAMRSLLAGRIRRVDLARVRTADGRARLYCGGGGLGLDAEAARHASESYARWAGKPRYILSALRAFRTFRPITVRAEFPGAEAGLVEKTVLLAAALNTPTYGAGLRLAANARIDDGLLDVVFVEELSLRQVAGIVFDWTVRGTLRSSRISTRRTSCVRLTPDRLCSFHGDGEILGPAPVEIEAVPQAIHVLAP